MINLKQDKLNSEVYPILDNLVKTDLSSAYNSCTKALNSLPNDFSGRTSLVNCKTDISEIKNLVKEVKNKLEDLTDQIAGVDKTASKQVRNTNSNLSSLNTTFNPLYSFANKNTSNTNNQNSSQQNTKDASWYQKKIEELTNELDNTYSDEGRKRIEEEIKKCQSELSKFSLSIEEFNTALSDIDNTVKDLESSYATDIEKIQKDIDAYKYLRDDYRDRKEKYASIWADTGSQEAYAEFEKFAKLEDQMQEKIDVLEAEKSQLKQMPGMIGDVLTSQTYASLITQPDFNIYSLSQQALNDFNKFESRWSYGVKKYYEVINKGEADEYLIPAEDSLNLFALLDIVDFENNSFTINDVRITFSDYQMSETIRKKTYMKLDELNTYNYLFSKHGKAEAEKYLEHITEEINKRQGFNEACNFLEQFIVKDSNGSYVELKNENGEVTGYKYDFSGLGEQANLFNKGFVDGTENFVEGIQDYLGGADGQMSAHQYEVLYIQQALNSATGSDSLFNEAFGYNFGTTIGNMAPAILTSAVSNVIVPGSGVIVGSTLMGVSAAGNAMEGAMQQGYSSGSARLYGTLVGTSEAVLGAFIGKIPGLSLMGKTWITNVLSEGGEEALQAIIDPMLRTMVLGEEFTIDAKEVTDSFIMGLLASGLLGSTQIYFDIKGVAVNNKVSAKNLSELYKIDYNNIGDGKYTSAVAKSMKKILDGDYVEAAKIMEDAGYKEVALDIRNSKSKIEQTIAKTENNSNVDNANDVQSNPVVDVDVQINIEDSTNKTSEEIETINFDDTMDTEIEALQSDKDTIDLEQKALSTIKNNMILDKQFQDYLLVSESDAKAENPTLNLQKIAGIVATEMLEFIYSKGDNSLQISYMATVSDYLTKKGYTAIEAIKYVDIAYSKIQQANVTPYTSIVCGNNHTIEILLDEKTKEQPNATPEEVKDYVKYYIEQLPPILQKTINTVTFHSDHAHSDLYWDYNYKDFIKSGGSAALSGFGEVSIYENPQYFGSTIFHESGHTLDTKLFEKLFPTNTNGGFISETDYRYDCGLTYNEAVNADKNNISEYAENALSEDFAESIKMFIKEKEIFKNKYPNRYKIFTEIFSLEDYETNPTLLGMLIQL